MNRARKLSDSVPYTSRIDLSRYDRTPELTCDECRIASRWAAPERPVITKRQLPRLYAPLADVLSYHGIAQSERSTTIKIVFVEVGRAKRPTGDGAINNGCADQSSVQNDRALLATAYLLSGFKRFYDVERNAHLLVTARLVFGRDVFDRECGRLMTALDRVGFKCRSMRSVYALGNRSRGAGGRRSPARSVRQTRSLNVSEASTVGRSASGSSC